MTPYGSLNIVFKYFPFLMNKSSYAVLIVDVNVFQKSLTEMEKNLTWRIIFENM